MLKAKYKLFLLMVVGIMSIVFLLNVSSVYQSLEAHADVGLKITNLSNDEFKDIRISNISNYTDYQKKRKSKKAIAKNLYKQLLYSDEEINSMNSEEMNKVLNSTYAVVKQYNIPKEENVEQQSLSASRLDYTEGNPEPGEEIVDQYPPDNQLPNWMVITIRVFQNTAHNRGVQINKDDGYTTTQQYGYDIDVTMRWGKQPVWRSDDMMVVAWTKLDRHPTRDFEKEDKPFRFNYKNSSNNPDYDDLWDDTYSLSATYNNITHKAIVSRYNLPSIGSGYSSFYSNHKVNLIASPLQDFEVYAAYAHREFGSGIYNVNSLNPIGFTASSIEVFETGRTYITVGSSVQPYPYPS